LQAPADLWFCAANSGAANSPATASSGVSEPPYGQHPTARVYSASLTGTANE